MHLFGHFKNAILIAILTFLVFPSSCNDSHGTILKDPHVQILRFINIHNSTFKGQYVGKSNEWDTVYEIINIEGAEHVFGLAFNRWNKEYSCIWGNFSGVDEINATSIKLDDILKLSPFDSTENIAIEPIFLYHLIITPRADIKNINQADPKHMYIDPLWHRYGACAKFFSTLDSWE